MLTVEGLSLYKNQRKIFSDLGFSLFLGAAIVVTGKNGSGKTSLMKVLSGICQKSGGDITWDGKNIEEMRYDFSADMQYIGHKNFLKPELTVEENLAFYASFYDSNILIATALNFFKITDLRHFKVKDLSAGMKQKVMLSRLMICPATLWILDEPDVNLDKSSKVLLAGLVKSKIENGDMVIMTSHEPELYDFAAILSMDDFN